MSFYGKAVETLQGWRRESTDQVEAVAYDTPVPGYATSNTPRIRLWHAQALQPFNLEYGTLTAEMCVALIAMIDPFLVRALNKGEYRDAYASQNDAEVITSVLYPNDNHKPGKLLRLKQQYLFASATLQDILKRFLEDQDSRDWKGVSSCVTLRLLFVSTFSLVSNNI